MVESKKNEQNDEFDFLEEESDQALQLYKKLDTIIAESPKHATNTASTASTQNFEFNPRQSYEMSDPFVIPLKKIMDIVYDDHLEKLPGTLKEALEQAQQVKELMYDEQIKRIVEV